MKTFCWHRFALLIVLASALHSAAAAPIKEFALTANHFTADPGRGRIYATIPASNSIVVINTTTLTLEKTIFVGSGPNDMAISPDKAKLYVTLTNATQIAVVDLNTLQTLPGLTIAGKPYEVEAGLGNRLYVSTIGQFTPLLQINATTGATQGTVNNQTYGNDHLAISPDRTSLFTGDNGISPADLRRFNIGSSTSSPGDMVEVGYNGESVVLSHNGRYVCFVNGAELIDYAISVFDPHNLSVVYGAFETGAYPNGIAFSPNDAVAYCVASSQPKIQLFSTKRFVALSSVPTVQSDFNDITTDGSGRHVFVAEPAGIRVYDVSAKLAAPATGNAGVAFTYQPTFDFPVTSYSAADLPAGLAINSSTGRISGTPAESGAFSILVTGSDGTTQSSLEIALNIFPNARALNISTRAQVQTDDDVLIAGFIISGSGNKTVIIRAIGPSLKVNNQPIPGRLADTTLELHDSAGTLVAFNDNWQTDGHAAQLIASGIPPTDHLESALYRTLVPGAYTAIVRGAHNTSGIGLVEVYEITGGVPRFADISTRGRVGTGDNVMIGGFIVAGPDSATMLVRALGPTLAAVGLQSTLADPHLDLYNKQGMKIATNNDWRDSQGTQIMASGIPPFNDRESAILWVLTPGNYTAVVSGVGNTAGLALIEAYNLP